MKKRCNTQPSSSVQRKIVVSDSPGLVDFAIGPVNSVTEELRNQLCSSKHFWGLGEMMFGLANASFSLPEWQAIKMTFFAPCPRGHSSRFSDYLLRWEN